MVQVDHVFGAIPILPESNLSDFPIYFPGLGNTHLHCDRRQLSEGDLQWYILGYFSHIFGETPVTQCIQYFARMTSVQAIMLFDATCADFVQQFPCPSCQHTG